MEPASTPASCYSAGCLFTLQRIGEPFHRFLRTAGSTH